MKRRIEQLSSAHGSLLLRELNHRINNELTCAMCAVSVKAMQSDNVAVKAALFLWCKLDRYKTSGVHDCSS
jgi:two-component sensor histidine kinase